MTRLNLTRFVPALTCAMVCLILAPTVVSAQHVQIISATSFCASGLPGIEECSAYRSLREWPGPGTNFVSVPMDTWYKVTGAGSGNVGANHAKYPQGSYNGSAVCRPPSGLTAECARVSVTYSSTATRPRPLTATPTDPIPDGATRAEPPETMAVLTYLGAEATNAIAPVCVAFDYSKLRTITDYSYGQEVQATLTATGYDMCVTWKWDSSDNCTGTAYGRSTPPGPGPLIFDYAENKKACVIPSGTPADTDWTLKVGHVED